MPNLKKIFVDDYFKLYVEFSDGQIRGVDLKNWIDGNSRVKQDLAFCKQAFIEHESIISWPTGISIDPEIIYDEGEKIDTFPTEKLPATGSYLKRVKALSTPS